METARTSSVEVRSTHIHPEPEVTQKRDRTQIHANILQVCLPRARITQIVYQANLNFKIAKPYLERLISAGLLRQELSNHNIKYWITTDVGREYLYHAERVII